MAVRFVLEKFSLVPTSNSLIRNKDCERGYNNDGQ